LKKKKKTFSRGYTLKERGEKEGCGPLLSPLGGELHDRSIDGYRRFSIEKRGRIGESVHAREERSSCSLFPTLQDVVSGKRKKKEESKREGLEVRGTKNSKEQEGLPRSRDRSSIEEKERAPLASS